MVSWFLTSCVAYPDGRVVLPHCLYELQPLKVHFAATLGEGPEVELSLA